MTPILHKRTHRLHYSVMDDKDPYSRSLTSSNKIFKYSIVCKGLHGNINITFPGNVGRARRRDIGRIRPGGIRKAGEERAVGRILNIGMPDK